MGLLQDILEEATTKNTDVPRLLRLCLLLASRLNHELLKGWATHELEGYPADEPLPAYRTLRGRNKGSFQSLTWHGTFEIPISVLPEDLQKHWKVAHFRDSVAEAVDLVATRGDDKQGGLAIHWPINMAVKYGSKTVRDGQCTGAWMEISPSEVVGLLDKIKTKVLAFALDIERVDPASGEAASRAHPTLPPEQVTQIFQTTIIGSTVHALAIGSSEVEQNALQGIQPGDVASLAHALKLLGADETTIAELKAAVKADTSSGAAGMGAKAKNWLADLALKAGQKGAEEGAKTVAATATKALLAYFGLN